MTTEPPTPPSEPHDRNESGAAATEDEPWKWGPPLVAVGAFFVIVGAISIGLYLFFTGRVGRRETIARPVTSIRISGEKDEPLAEAWLLIRSTTDRRILGRYQKLVGATAILRANAKGEILLPTSINKHDNLDLFAWQDGYRAAACRRFVKKGARPTDMFVVRGSADPARPLTPGETIAIRLGPAQGEDGETAREKLRKQLSEHDASLHHRESLSVEQLLAVLNAGR